jgi:hypothetical protein
MGQLMKKPPKKDLEYKIRASDGEEVRRLFSNSL